MYTAASKPVLFNQWRSFQQRRVEVHSPETESFLTPREAARVQTFPYWFMFHKARKRAFRLIGNAVPPALGRAIGIGAKQYLIHAERISERPTSILPLLSDADEAVSWLELLVSAIEERSLSKVPTPEFKRGWFALGCLYPQLHPEGVRNNGIRISDHFIDLGSASVRALDFASPIYTQGSCPVGLVPDCYRSCATSVCRHAQQCRVSLFRRPSGGNNWIDEEE